MPPKRSRSPPKYLLESNNRLNHFDNMHEAGQHPQLQAATNTHSCHPTSSSLAYEKEREVQNLSKRHSLIKLVYQLCLIVTCGASGLILLSVVKFLPQQLTFDHPTVGIPSPGKVYNNTKISAKDLPYFDQQFNQLFKPYNDTNCQYARFGFDEDGGYVICKNFLQNSEALINVGINSEDSFGCHVTAAYPIPNYQYDCKNTYQPKCSSDGNRNQFFRTCLGQKTHQTGFYEFSTYEDILLVHNLTEKHVNLKLDCEGCEYAAFKALPLAYLDLIDQIVIEVHFGAIFREEWGMLDVFRALGDRFVSVNYHNNNLACLEGEAQEGRELKSIAIELTLVNRRLITLHSQSRSFTEHWLNRNNWLGRDKCT